MTIAAAALQIILWIWFLGCVTTWRFGKVLLVEGMGLKSAEFGMLCAYSLGIAAYWLFPVPGKWILFGILLAWLTVQFMCHWYYTIFGAGEAKLKGYNECFRGAVYLIPPSDTRLIPDLYHILLHLLILANLVLCLVR